MLVYSSGTEESAVDLLVLNRHCLLAQIVLAQIAETTKKMDTKRRTNRNPEQALSLALSISCELIMGCQMLGDRDENQFFLNTPEKMK